MRTDLVAVISVEPAVGDSPAPFAIEPPVAGNIEALGAGTSHGKHGEGAAARVRRPVLKGPSR
ncbi:MAG TPA: hypothetical protein ENK57_19975 [Polyangiaceae bacterium]|nr:hypothetical protein [Polyangiaceae bacterium]